jgi:hypothetical protein
LLLFVITCHYLSPPLVLQGRPPPQPIRANVSGCVFFHPVFSGCSRLTQRTCPRHSSASHQGRPKCLSMSAIPHVFRLLCDLCVADRLLLLLLLLLLSAWGLAHFHRLVFRICTQRTCPLYTVFAYHPLQTHLHRSTSGTVRLGGVWFFEILTSTYLCSPKPSPPLSFCVCASARRISVGAPQEAFSRTCSAQTKKTSMFMPPSG